MAFSTITPVQLGQAPITNGYTTIYTVPVSTRTFVKDIDICNTTAGAVNVTVNLVPKSGSPTTDNALLYHITLPAYTVFQWSGSQIMDTEGTIQVFGSAVGCTITASGGEAI